MSTKNNVPTNRISGSKVRVIQFVTSLLSYVFLLIGSVLLIYYSGRRGNPTPLRILYYVSFALNVLQISVVIVKFVLRQTGYFFGQINLIETILGLVWEVILIAEFVVACSLFSAFRVDCLLISLAQGTVVVLMVVYSRRIDYRVNKRFNRLLSRKGENFTGHSEVLKRREILKSALYALVSVFVFGIQVFALAIPMMPPRIDDIFSENRVINYTYIKNKSGYTDGYYVSNVYLGLNDKVVVPLTYNDKPVVGILTDALKDVGIISSLTIGERDRNGELKSNVEIIEDGAIELKRIKSLDIPASVKKIGYNGICADSLEEINYYSDSDFSSLSFKTKELHNFNIYAENRIVAADYENINATVNVPKGVYNGYRESFFASRAKFELDDKTDVVVIDFETNANAYLGSKILKKGEAVLDVSSLKNDGEESGPYVKDTVRYNKNKFTCDGFVSKDGYAFRGWYRDPEYTVECDFGGGNRIYFDADTTIYAKWEKIKTLKLNWSNYFPYNESVTTIKYVRSDKTGEVVALPKLKRNGGDITRIGFESLRWRVNNKNVYCEKTSDLVAYDDDNFTATAVWGLEKPTIETYTLNTANVKNGNSDYSFIFDENKNERYVAEMSHASDKVNLTYVWKKKNADGTYSTGNPASGSNKETFTKRIRNVEESGDYQLEVRAKCNTGEQSVSTKNYRVTVIKKALDIGSSTVSPDEKVYNGNAQSHDKQNFALPQNIGFATQYKINGTWTYSAPKNANDQPYPVRYIFSKTGAEADNYSAYTLETTLRITPKPVDVVWNDISFEYNAYNHQPSYSVSGKCGNDSVAFILSGDANKRDAGDYSVWVSGTNNPNYIPSDKATEPKSWNITPKTITATWESAKKKTYNGSAQYFRLYLSGIARADVNTNVKIGDFATSSDSALGVTYDSDGIKFEVKDAKSYAFTVSSLNNKNYRFTNTSETYEIEPANLTVSWSGLDTEYNGREQSAIATIGGFKAGDEAKVRDVKTITGASEVSIQERSSGNVEVEFKATNANTYSCALSEQTLYDGNYTLGANEQTFTITQRELTGTWDNKELVYNGDYQSVSCIFDVPKPDRPYLRFTTDEVVDCSQVVDGNSIKLTFKVKDVKDYTASITSLVAEDRQQNYTFKSTSKTFTVKPYIVKGVWNANSSEYDGKTQNVIYTATLPTESDAEKFVFDCNGGVLSVDGKNVKVVFDVKEAKTYDFSIDGFTAHGMESNFAFTPVTHSFTVAKRPVEFEWSSAYFTYDGNTHTVSASVKNRCGSDTINITYSGNSAVNAGNYTASVSIDNPNYTTEGGKNTTKSWRISKKGVSLYTDGGEVAYNGRYQYFELRYNGFTNADLINLKQSDFGYSSSSDISGIAALLSDSKSEGNDYVVTFKAIDAAKYNITLLSDVNSNYYIKTKSATFTVDKKKLHYSWDYNNESPFVYDKIQKTVYPIFETTDFCTREDNGVADGTGYSVSGNQKTNAGTYTARLDSITNTNYMPVGEEQAWKINKRTIDVSWNANEFTFNAAHNSPRATATNLMSGDSVTFGYKYYNSGRNVDTTVNAGIYSAEVVSIGGNNNYVLTSEKPKCSYKILPKELTLEYTQGTNLKYDGSYLCGISLKVSGFPSVAESNNFSVDKFKLSTTSGINTSKSSASLSCVIAFASRNAGDYSVKVLGVADGYTNYYVREQTERKYTIARRVIAVRWGQSTLEYDGNVKSLLPTVTNGVGGDSVALKYDYSGVSYTGNVMNLGKVTDAGKYTVKIIGVDNENYTVDGMADSSKNFTVNKRKIKPVLASSTAFTYNGEEQYVTYSVSGFVNKDASLFAQNPFVYTGGDTVKYDQVATKALSFGVTKAGVYSVKINGLKEQFVNSNYEFDSASAVDSTFSVSKRVVTVNWGATSYIYNSEMQSVSPKITNVCGEDEITLNLKNHSATDAGNYKAEITALNGKDASNYTLPSVVNKEWTIMPASLSFTWTTNSSLVYDGQYKTASLTVKGFTKKDVSDIRFETGFTEKNNKTPYDTVCNTADGSVVFKFREVDAGNYTYCVSTNLSNYTGSDGTRNLKISAREAKLEWSVPSFTYDGTEKSVTCRVSNVCSRVDEKTDHPNLTLSNDKKINAGTYTASVTKVDDANYVLPSIKSTSWIIGRVLLTNEWLGNDSVVYDGNSHSLTLRVKGFVHGDETNCKTMFTESRTSVKTSSAGIVSFTFTTSEAGSYDFGVSRLSDTNYSFTATQKTLNIKKKSLIATWSGKVSGYNYNSTEHPTVLTISGFVSDPAKAAFNVTGACDYSFANDTAKFTFKSRDAGDYCFSVAYNNKNYSSVNEKKNFTVTPKKLTAVWNEAIVGYEYNGTEHNTVLTISGFVSDPTKTAFTVTGACDYSFANDTAKFVFKSRDAGKYDFGVKYAGKNYSSVSEAKNLVVSAAKLTSAWIGNGDYTYNGVDNVIVLRVSGFKSDADASAATSSFVSAGNLSGVKAVDCAVEFTFTAKNVGTYKFSVSSLKNSNYAFSAQSKTVTVSKKALSAYWEDSDSEQTTVYDGSEHTSVLVITGFAKCDLTQTETGKLSVNAAYAAVISDGVVRLSFKWKDVGTYNFEVFGISDENYEMASAGTKTVTVEKKTLYAAWSGNQTVVYDGNAHNIRLTVSGFVGGEGKSVAADCISVSPDGVFTSASDKITYTYSKVNAGEYLFVVNGINSSSNKNIMSNYSMSNNSSVKLTIKPKTLKVSESKENIYTFDGTEHKAYIEIKGFAYKEGDFEITGDPNTTITADTVRFEVSSTNANGSGYEFSIKNRNANYILESEPTVRLIVKPRSVKAFVESNVNVIFKDSDTNNEVEGIGYTLRVYSDEEKTQAVDDCSANGTYYYELILNDMSAFNYSLDLTEGSFTIGEED